MTPGALVKKAHHCFNEGDLNAAKDLYQKAFEMDEKHVPTLVGLGEIALHEEDFKEALGFLNSAFVLQQDCWPAITKKALVLFNLGCYTETVQLAQKVLDSNHPSSKASQDDAYFFKGLALFYQGNYHEANGCFLRLPSNSYALCYSGFAYLFSIVNPVTRKKNLASAKLYFEMGKNTDNASLQLLCDLGIALAEPDIQSYLPRLIMRASIKKNDVFFILLGICFRINNNYKEALKCFDKAEMGNPHILFQKALALTSMALKDKQTEPLILYDQAILILQTILKEHKDNIDVITKLTEALQRKAKFLQKTNPEEACGYLTQALDCSPRDPYTTYLLAEYKLSAQVTSPRAAWLKAQPAPLQASFSLGASLPTKSSSNSENTTGSSAIAVIEPVREFKASVSQDVDLPGTPAPHEIPIASPTRQARSPEAASPELTGRSLQSTARSSTRESLPALQPAPAKLENVGIPLTLQPKARSRCRIG